MGVPNRRRPRLPLRLTAWLAFSCAAVGSLTTSAAEEETAPRVDLLRDVASAGDLTAPANGQTLYVLDEANGSVVAIDPFEPQKRWMAVAATAPATAPLAIASLDTGTLVALAPGPNGWTLTTHRVQPGTTANPGEPLQKLSIGAAVADGRPRAGTAAARPRIAVSPSRDWLAVTGLEPPAAAVLRAPIAGVRIGAASSRSCPQLPADVRPAAVTISPTDEFVIFATDPSAAASAGIFVSFWMPPNPRRLLHLDTGLTPVHDAAFCRSDGTLWAVGGQPGSGTTPEGLWRIDAVMREGRQAARAVCVARLEGAVSLACLSERTIVVTHGRTARIVSRIDPTRSPDGRAAAGGDAPTPPQGSSP